MLSISFEIPINWEYYPITEKNDREWLETRDRCFTYTDIQLALDPSYIFHETWKKEFRHLFGKITLIHNEQKIYLHVIDFDIFLSSVTADIKENICNNFYVSEDFLFSVYPPENDYLRLEFYFDHAENEFQGEHTSKENLPTSLMNWGDKLVNLASFKLPVVDFYKLLIPEAQKIMHIEKTLKNDPNYMSHIEENIQRIKNLYHI